MEIRSLMSYILNIRYSSCPLEGREHVMHVTLRERILLFKAEIRYDYRAGAKFHR